MAPRTGPLTRTKLLDAAVHTLRERGYGSTRVDEVCASTGVTKGGFFHHFESKEALALAAIDHFAARASASFGETGIATLADPRARVLAYVDWRIAMLDGELVDVTCLHGTLVQEIYTSHPALLAAAGGYLEAGIAALAKELAAAKRRHAPEASWSPKVLARFVESTVQGAFVLAKATSSTKTAVDCLRYLRAHLEECLGEKRESS